NASVVQRAPSTAWALYEPAPCSDISLLLARPVSPVARPKELVAQFARARALNDTGQYAAAVEEAAAVRDQARARKDRALELSALIELAHAAQDIDPPEKV